MKNVKKPKEIDGLESFQEKTKEKAKTERKRAYNNKKEFDKKRRKKFDDE